MWRLALVLDNIRFKYQTIEFEDIDIHVRTLRDTQQFYDKDNKAEKLGINSASWSLFGVLWPSSQILANYVHQKDTSSKRILEIGCGIGLSSLLLNHAGEDITATDYHPEVEAFLETNTQLNDDEEIPFFRADWEKFEDKDMKKFDLIIGSDILYQRDHIEILSNFIKKCANEKCEVIIVDPNRGNRSKFTTKMNEYGFTNDRIDTSKYTDIDYKGSINIYRR